MVLRVESGVWVCRGLSGAHRGAGAGGLGAGGVFAEYGDARGQDVSARAEEEFGVWAVLRVCADWVLPGDYCGRNGHAAVDVAVVFLARERGAGADVCDGVFDGAE